MLHIAIAHSFWLRFIIVFYTHTTIYLSILLSEYICMVSRVLLFMNNAVMHIFVHIYWWTCVSIFLRARLLGCKVFECSTSRDDARPFPKWLHNFTLPPAMCRRFCRTALYQHLILPNFLISDSQMSEDSISFALDMQFPDH